MVGHASRAQHESGSQCADDDCKLFIRKVDDSIEQRRIVGNKVLHEVVELAATPRENIRHGNAFQ